MASMATVSQLAKSNQIPQHSVYAFHELGPMQALSPNSAKSKSDSFMGMVSTVLQSKPYVNKSNWARGKIGSDGRQQSSAAGVPLFCR